MHTLRKAAMAVVLFALCAVAAVGAELTSGVLAPETRWRTPYDAVVSGVDGPKLLIVGGIHGNEPAGYLAAQQIRHWPVVKGQLIVIPGVNRPGLKANARYLPGEPADVRDLNRNFPRDRLGEGARGEIAQHLWQFVEKQRPEWVLDLHEGYEFHVSHRPPEGKDKSVGSTLIFEKDPTLVAIARRMQQVANATVNDPDRRFVLLSRGPKETSLVRACTQHLNAKGMILETTFNHQPVSLRTRQHRVMVNVLMHRLGMIDRDCADVMTGREQDESIDVGLYDGPGVSDRSVGRLARIVDEAPEMTLHYLGPADMRPAVLEQFDAIVFPGGSGSKQAQAIGPAGQRHVRDFVRTGGGCLGVCAGAYLCSAHYAWSLDLVDASVFTGLREVEGLGKKPMWYRGKSSTVKMELTEEGRRLFAHVPGQVEVTYQNGPIMAPKRDPCLSPYTPLAYFTSERVLYEPQRGTMDGAPAIVAGRFHQGRVIAISPHPEATDSLHPIITESIRWITARCPPTISFDNSRDTAHRPSCAPAIRTPDAAP